MVVQHVSKNPLELVCRWFFHALSTAHRPLSPATETFIATNGLSRGAEEGCQKACPRLESNHGVGRFAYFGR